MSSGNTEGTHSVTQGSLVESIAQQIHHALLTLRNSSTNVRHSATRLIFWVMC